MLCIYHSADLDGHCSGAIVKCNYPKCKLYGVDYGQKIPWELISEHDKIFLVDFSFEYNDMVKLINNYNIIWIDHHKSAIESMSCHQVFGNQEVGRGACELTWEYIFPEKKIPLAVKFLSQYDVWNHSDERTLPFQYGMRILDTYPNNQELWQSLFRVYNNGLTYDIIDQGETVLLYIEKENKILSKQSFKLEFEGYKCIAVNKSGNSKMFDFVKDIDKYDIKLTFMYKYNSWTIIMYTSQDNVDVSKIALKYGGGGHKQAAGFQINKLPFSLK